jgi:hypothetical protein
MSHRTHPASTRPTVALALFVAFAATALGAPAAEAQAKPDLRVSRISTPGGLCVGNDGKVQVNIQNSSQQAPVKETVPVKLTISQPPAPPTAHLAYIENGIGPNGNQAAWFHNVPIAATGSVTLHAHVNPDLQIEESNYRNNDRRQTVTVTSVCGAPPPPPAGATLTVSVYQTGTWSGGQGQWIPGANVSVSCGTVFSANGQTGSNGKVSFPGTPKSPPTCTISVSKPGCTSNSLGFGMPSYNTNRNVDISC